MNSNDVIIQKLLIPICSKEQFTLLKGTASDKLPDTFEKWEEKQMTLGKDLSNSGFLCSRVDIDVNAMNKWFEKNHIQNKDEAARQQYAWTLISGEPAV